jgi:hypothetical protein
MATLRDDPACTAASTKCYTELEKDREIVKVKFPVLYLNEIPEAMDKMYWTVSAKMMRYWFANPAWHMSPLERGGYHNGNKDDSIIYAQLPAERINETIITMKWARRFSRFEKVLDAWRSKWNDAAAGVLLAKRLKRAGWQPGGTSFTLGKVGEKASVMDNHNQINSTPFGDYLDPLDDFYGAIFKANLKVAVVGYAYFDWRRCENIFVVTDIGYYIRDTYDFNDGDKISDDLVDIYFGLGIWSRDRVLSKKESCEYDALLAELPLSPVWPKYKGFVKLNNSDFYRWAAKHKTGGDFYVFSDVLWEKPFGRLEIPLPASAEGIDTR